ncbi:MAG: hypothetical protein KC422_12975 [Trueperaceae bacterium]|nr:hypothetical protein [Trueperaceae bacterium]
MKHLAVKWLVSTLLVMILGVGGFTSFLWFQANKHSEIALDSLTDPDQDQAGDLVAVTQLGYYYHLLTAFLIRGRGLPAQIEVSSGMRLYRLEYRTAFKGKLVNASGLLALPTNPSRDAVVVYSHGTNAVRADVPSKPSFGDGVFVSSLIAGGGYIFLAPDYLGLGISEQVQPYFYADSSVSSTLDLLKAARSFVRYQGYSWPSGQLLVGFSEGGWATSALHRALEQQDDPHFQVLGTATVAAPFDLANISVPFAFEGKAGKTASFYLAFLAFAYSTVYDQPLETLLKESYASQIPQLFDGEHATDSILKALPEVPREMFQTSFLVALDERGDHWFLRALEENGVYDWSPIAPLRAYYGDDDVDVSPRESQYAVQHMQALGGNAMATSLGPYDHFGSLFKATPEIRMWFDSLAPQDAKKAN